MVGFRFWLNTYMVSIFQVCYWAILLLFQKERKVIMWSPHCYQGWKGHSSLWVPFGDVKVLKSNGHVMSLTLSQWQGHLSNCWGHFRWSICHNKIHPLSHQPAAKISSSPWWQTCLHHFSVLEREVFGQLKSSAVILVQMMSTTALIHSTKTIQAIAAG